MENKQNNNNPSRSELITDFVKTNPSYYIEEFKKIGSKPWVPKIATKSGPIANPIDIEEL